MMSQMNTVLNVYAYSQGTFLLTILMDGIILVRTHHKPRLNQFHKKLSDPSVFFKSLPTTTVKQVPSWIYNSYLLRHA
jgi:hypothetical protein